MDDGAKDEILEAISLFSTAMDEKFLHLEKRIDGLETKVEGIDGRLSTLESDMSLVKATIATQMVTKDYLDDKMEDLRVELGGGLRKVDEKDTALVHELRESKFVSPVSAQRIEALSPFAK